MFKLLIVALVAYHCQASSYSSSWSDNSGLRLIGSGYGGGYGGGDRWGSSSSSHNIPLAVQSHRSLDVIPVHSSGSRASTTVVDIDPVDLPVELNFLTKSSSLRTNQRHISRPGSVQHQSTVDGTHRLIQEIIRPVQQEVREIIVPSRSIVQEIRPVQESVRTVVARGERNNNGGGLDGGLGDGGLGGGLGLGRGLGGGDDDGLGGNRGGYGRGLGGGKLLSLDLGGGGGSGSGRYGSKW